MFSGVFFLVRWEKINIDKTLKILTFASRGMLEESELESFPPNFDIKLCSV